MKVIFPQKIRQYNILCFLLFIPIPLFAGESKTCELPLPDGLRTIERQVLINPKDPENYRWETCEQAVERYLRDRNTADGASEKANEVSLEQKIGSQTTQAIGVFSAAKAASTCPQGPNCGFYVAGAAASFGASFMLNNMSNKNKDTRDIIAGRYFEPDSPNPTTTTGSGLTTGGGPTTGGNPLPTPPPRGISGPPGGGPSITPPIPNLIPDPTNPRQPFPHMEKPEDLSRYIKDRFNMDYDPSKGTITLPGGQTYSADNFDPSAVPASELQNFKDQIKGIENQVRAAVNAHRKKQAAADKKEADEEGEETAKAAGGFKGYGGGGRKKSAKGKEAGLLSQTRQPNSDNSAAVSGMSVRYGRDRIGVSQDNIFDMIHRRYQKKRKDNFFIENR